MKSSIFGLKSWFYNQKEINSSLSDLVQENGFNSFSPEGVTSYLTFRYPIGDLTMFKDIKRVPAGSEYVLEKLNRYWNPFFAERVPKSTIPQTTIKQMLLSVIKRYENEKIAFLLSGGVDSSLLVALYRELYPSKEIRTYIAGFENSNEFDYAQIVADRFNTLHTEVMLTKKDFFINDVIKSLIAFKGEPLHPNELPLAMVEIAAKHDGCTAVMCGEGADDIFGGYSHNLCMFLNYSSLAFNDFMGVFLDHYRYFSLEDRNKIINSDYLVNDKSLLMKYLFKEEIPYDARNWIFYFTQKIHTVGLIIRGVNAIKYNSLIPIFPYIDPQLVEYVNSLPFYYKLHWKDLPIGVIDYKTIADDYTIPKYILKKLAESFLPKEVIYRKKVPFPMPFDEIMFDVQEWDFDSEIFLSTDISSFNGWKKFMLINLDIFIKEYRLFQQKV